MKFCFHCNEYFAFARMLCPHCGTTLEKKYIETSEAMRFIKQECASLLNTLSTIRAIEENDKRWTDELKRIVWQCEVNLFQYYREIEKHGKTAERTTALLTPNDATIN